MIRDAALVAAKDLRLEWRSRVGIGQVLPFAVLCVLLFAFALDPDRNVLERATGGLFWMVVLFAAVLTAYTLFFTRENLLDVNMLVYVLPIVSMTATLILIRKNASFDEIPGFDRLSGLMVLIAITFVFVLIIERTRIWVLFGGSLASLAALVVGLYALLKWAAYMVFRRKDEPRVKPPSLKLP